MVAASSKVYVPSGIIQARSAYTLTYSAKPPRSLSTPPRREAATLSPTFTGTRRFGPACTTVPAKSHPRIVPGLVPRLASVVVVSIVVYFAGENVRTLPVGRVDGNRRHLDKDFVLTNCGNRTLLCPDGLVRLDDDRSVGLWDIEVGHIESFFEPGEGGDVGLLALCSVRSFDLYTFYPTLFPLSSWEDAESC